MIHRSYNLAVQILRHLRCARNRNVAWSVFLGPNVQLDFGATIWEHVRLEHDVLLGPMCTVGRYATLSNMEVGRGSHIERGVVVTGHGKGRIIIGQESYVGIYNVLDWSDDITIGDFVHIAGPGTGLWTHSSVEQALAGDPLSHKMKRTTKPIHIKSNVYIGGNCTIYPGVTIGPHAVVAPNSAVIEDVAPHSMIGGVPARVIKQLQ